MSDIKSKISIEDGFSNPLMNFISKLTKSSENLGKLGSDFGKVGDEAEKGRSSLEEFANTKVGGFITEGIDHVKSGLSSLSGQVGESAKAWDTFEEKMAAINRSQGFIDAAKGEMQGFVKQTVFGASEIANAYYKLDSSGTRSTGELTKSLAKLAQGTKEPSVAFDTLADTSAEVANKPMVAWGKFENLLNKMPNEMAKVASSMHMEMADMIKDAEAGQLKTETFLSGLRRAGGGGTVKPPNQLGGNGTGGGGASPQAPRSGLLSFSGKPGGMGLGSILGGNLISAGIVGTIGAVTSGIHSMAQELDESTKAWDTFDGNMKQIGMPKAKIEAARNDMQKFAQDTIYSSSDMASTYSQLAATGTKNVGQLVKGFGGLAAASSDPKQAMKTLSQQGTQMAAKPMIQWQDFKLMMEQTPAGISAVAKAMHKTNAGLMQDIQAGKVKTQDFFDAVAHTGTNKVFTEMATHYKTVGEAIDGTKETLANQLKPAWKTLSGVVIDSVSKINDGIGNLNFDSLATRAKPYLKGFIDGLEGTLVTAGHDVAAFWGSIVNTGVVQNVINTVNSVKGAFNRLFEGNGKKDNNDPLAPFKSLGNFAGNTIQGLANLTNAISKLDPSTLKELAVAFVILKASTKGLVLTGIAIGLNMLAKANPTVLHLVAGGIVALASALAIFKTVMGIRSAFGMLKNGISSITGSSGSLAKTAGNVKESTVSFIKMGAGLLLAGVGIAFAGGGMWLMADAAIRLTNAGWPAIAVMAGMIVVIVAIVAIAAIFSGAIITAAIALGALGVALLIVSAAVFVTAAGVALLAGALPNIATNGLSAAGALVVLGASLLAFSVLAAISAVGIIVFAAGLLVLSAGMVVAAAASVALGAAFMVLSAGLIAVGVGLMVAAAGAAAMANAIKGNFSGAKDAIGGVKDAIGGIKDAASSKINMSDMFSGLGGISAKADSTKNHVDSTKMTPKLDNSQALGNMDALSNHNIKAPKMEQPKLPNGNIFAQFDNQAQNKTIKAPKVEQPKTLAAPKMEQPKVSGDNGNLLNSLQAQYSNKTLESPKVAQPKVPQPKMPSNAGKTLPAPKVAQPKTPQPKLPAKTGTIPAPKVAKPNMNVVVNAVKSGMNQAVNVVKGTYGSMYSAGSYVGQGLANGIRSQISNVASAANDLISQADRAARAKARIHSPSRLFAEIGDYLGQGMAKGMNGTTDLVNTASGNLNDAAVDGITDSINAPTLNNQNKFNPSKDEFAKSGQGGTGSNITNSNANTSNNNTSSKSINIENGAIQIISNGKSDEDIEKTVGAIEDYLTKIKEGKLSE